MRGRRILVIGDGQARSLYYAFSRAMGDDTSNSHNGTAPRHADIRVGLVDGGRMTFLWAPFVANITHRIQTHLHQLKSVKAGHGFDAIVLSAGSWDAFYGRDETYFISGLFGLRASLSRLGAHVPESCALLWMTTTMVVDSRLKSGGLMNEAVMTRYRSAVENTIFVRTMDGVIDGLAVTRNRAEDCVDGLNYHDVVYDVMAQIGLNSMRTKWAMRRG
uniref:Uncharacterized protein n=1 Tax=Octactis speculum TaxID=3111310 RepID=A0A7S2F6X9_9STRA|mmetsp:Transcript_15699/g.21124  ORF Transcript_15699/g.21124 Transcript_15699/m.21124 type:complete len:218 (+) Transcript_15699:81-734(+)